MEARRRVAIMILVSFFPGKKTQKRLKIGTYIASISQGTQEQGLP